MSCAFDESPVREGDVIDGKFAIDEVIGVGGMGVVVAARHTELGQRVALKFMLPQALGVPGAVERFMREARSAVQLQSQHVARVYDVGRMDSGIPYLVMELLQGCDLGFLVRNQGPLRIGDAVEYLIQASEAVAEAHALGIVHRDLKPANLFLTRRINGAPLVKVLDFGISKITNLQPTDASLTKTSDVVGSPYYMAPEQVRSARDVDARTDIWALGVILYELLSGKVPFQATNVPQLCAKVLEEEPATLHQLRPDVPVALSEVVATCLGKRPEQRYACVQELVQALAPFAATGVSLAPAAGGPQMWTELPDLPPEPVRSSMTLGETMQQDSAAGPRDTGPPHGSEAQPGWTASSCRSTPTRRRRFRLVLGAGLLGGAAVAALAVAVWISLPAGEADLETPPVPSGAEPASKDVTDHVLVTSVSSRSGAFAPVATASASASAAVGRERPPPKRVAPVVTPTATPTAAPAETTTAAQPVTETTRPAETDEGSIDNLLPSERK